MGLSEMLSNGSVYCFIAVFPRLLFPPQEIPLFLGVKRGAEKRFQPNGEIIWALSRQL